MLNRLMRQFFYLTLFWVLLESCASQTPDSTQNQASEISQLKILKEKYKDSIDLQLRFASALFETGDTTLAIQELYGLKARFPNKELVINSLAYALLKKQDTLSSMKELRESIILNLNQPEIEMELAYLYASRKNDTCLLLIDQMISDFTNQARRAHGFFTLGIYLTNTGDLKRAVQAYDSCIVNQFTYTDAYLEKSIALYDLKKNNESIATLLKALEIDSKNSDIFAWIGFNYQKLGDTDKANQYFKEALRLNPDRTDIH
jgi:tetratricopeptide (TPR) repeat protein